MSDLPNPDEPEYLIPLSTEQLTELGRLMAAWSQIDFLIILAIAAVTKTEVGWMLTFCENMMSGARVNLLRRILPNMPSDEARTFAESLCSRLGKLIGRRNHLIHGIWGIHVDREKKTRHPACHDGHNPAAPIYAAELPDLRKRAIAETRQLGLLLKMIAPQHFGRSLPPVPFLFGSGPPPDLLAEPLQLSGLDLPKRDD
jgi:hypothetical protein